MKRSKIILAILSILLITSLLPAIPLTVSAASEGTENLGDIIGGGKNPLMKPEFIDGGKGFGWDNEDNPTKESSPSLFVYEEESEDNPKYCASMNADEQPEHGGAYWAEWKYDKEYSINRIIFQTGNDSESYPRRMGDGYTISGSNDGSSWDVIYTGKEMDTGAANFMYYYIDIDPSTPYQYYRLFSDKAGVSQDDGGENQGMLIQYSMLILCSADAPAYTPPWKRQSYTIGEETTVIRAIDFDAGADNYYETNAADGDHTVRTEEEVQTEVGTSGFGGNIGWINAGEWVQYTVRFGADGKYKFKAYLASNADNPGTVEIYVDDKLVGESDNVVKEDWQAYQWYDVGEISVASGARVIKTEFPTGGLNIAALEITRIGDAEFPAEDEAPPPAVDGDGNENAAGGDDDGDSGEAPANAGDNDNKNTGSDDGDGGINNLIIIIIGGAALLVIIIVILVIVTKKKKA